MPDSVLVTGGAGYIGAHVVHALIDQGDTPVVVDNLSNGIREFVPDHVPFLFADIKDDEKLLHFMTEHACQSVIHMAGSVRVDESIKKPMLYFSNNTCASQNLISSCITHGIKNFLFSSTAAVYGNPDEGKVSETVPAWPVSPYGWSKLMTEKMLESICAVEAMNSISLRYFNVAGADPMGRCGMVSENATHLLKILCETALGKREEFTIFGDDYDTKDGTCVRDFIHVSDLASIHVAALNYLKGGNLGGVFNCGYGTGFSVRQVAQKVQQIHGKDFNIKIGPRRAGDIVSLIADTSKINETLNWQPIHNDLEKIVETALTWEGRI